MKKFIVDTKYGNYLIEAENAKAAATLGHRASIKDAVSVEQFRRTSALLKCIRADLASELDTINNYEEHAAMAADLGYDNIVKLLNDIRNEERVHVGELIAALSEIDKQDGTSFNEGVDEASKLLNTSFQSPSMEENSDSMHDTESNDIGFVLKQTGANNIGSGTYNNEPVYFLSFSTPQEMASARDILGKYNIEILQSTESPVAELYMLTIKELGE